MIRKRQEQIFLLSKCAICQHEIMINEVFWGKLKHIYLKHEGGDEEWKQEEPALQKILPAIQAELNGWYEIDAPINRGGAGLVIKLQDLRLARAVKDIEGSTPTYRALKIPRPILDREELLIALLNKEAAFLASLTHSNVIKIYAFGIVPVEFAQKTSGNKKYEYPYYVMDYIHDATSPVDYMARASTTLEDLKRTFSDILEGYCYLSEMNVCHNDPKPANILVDTKGRAIISDLGSAKRKDSSDSVTTIPFTRHYAPPDKKNRATGPATDDDRVRLTIKPKEIPLLWDIYSVGLSLLEILEVFSTAHPREMRKSGAKHIILYLRLLTGRMLGNDIMETQTILSLPKCFYEQLRYTQFEEAKQDLDKLSGKVSLEVLVPELDIDSKRVIQCPMSGTVPLTDRLSEVLKHPALQRLMSVTQLGLLNYIYPNATHSRYEHSLGAYGNAVRMIHALWEDQQNPLFRQIMNKSDLEACLLAVLLHDLGQYPLAHDLEEADKDFFHHEPLSMDFISKPFAGNTKTLASVIDSFWGVGMSDRMKKVFNTKPNNFKGAIKDRILHTIVDGPLDADKLDYISRDSSRLHVPYGLILDYERIFLSLTVVHERQGDDLYATIGIHEKGRTGAECVAYARYALFSAVYWHHTSRAIKAMIHRAVWEMSKLHKVSRAELMNLLLDNNLPPIQASLFADDKGYSRPTWPGIAPTDLQILVWIWDNTSKAGRQIIEGLIERKVFKRALVVAGSQHRDLIKKLQKIRRSGENAVENMIRLEKLIAEKIAGHLEGLSIDRRNETDAFSDKISRSFWDRVQAGEVLVLIDIPKPELSNLDELRCLPETDRWKPVTEYTKPITLQDSPVWSSLVESFGEGAGKIRLLVHPDFADTVRNLTREELEGLLNASATETLG
jgi:HD superfamily phosphohydrolase